MTFQVNLKQYFPHYLQLDSFKEFWHLCLNNYIALPILLALLTAYYLRQRTGLAWLRLVLVWGSVAGYAFIVNVSKPGYVEPTYLDNLFLPLAFFVGIPFTMELLPALERAPALGQRAPQLAAVALGLVLAARLLVLYGTHRPYTAYQHWLQRLMAYTRPLPERRYLLDSNNVDPANLRAGTPYWASSYETILLSARPSPDSAQVIYITNEMDLRLEPSRTPGIFLGPFTAVPAKGLTASYFRVANDAAGFRLLNTPPPATDTIALRAYIAARRATQLALLHLPTTSANYWGTVQVRISPPPGQLLHSGLRTNYGTVLRSRFLTSVDWPAENSTVEMPLEVDVDHPWVQNLPLNCPTKPGKYLLEVGLVSRNYRDWPVLVRVPVEVK